MSYLGLLVNGVVVLDLLYFAWCGVQFSSTLKKRRPRQNVLIAGSFFLILVSIAMWLILIKWLLYSHDPYTWSILFARTGIVCCLGAVVLARFADRGCAIALIATSVIASLPWISTLWGA